MTATEISGAPVALSNKQNRFFKGKKRFCKSKRRLVDSLPGGPVKPAFHLLKNAYDERHKAVRKKITFPELFPF